MNNELKNKIEKIRHELSKEPLAMIIGKLNAGKACIENELVKPYRDFLSVCNGARCGAIDLWSDELIGSNQYRVAALMGSNKKWLCIGQVLYEPLVINMDTEAVYLFYQGCENEAEGRFLGKFDDFLSNYVFGEKYAEVIPDAEREEWYGFIRRFTL